MKTWWRNPEVWVWVAITILAMAACKFGGEMWLQAPP